MREEFDKKKFDVEHAVHMYATSNVIMPASAIYQDDIIKKYKDQLKTCHIYLIGLVPKIDFIGAKHDGGNLVTSFEILSERYDLIWPMPTGAKLMGGAKGPWYVVDLEGRKSFPNENTMRARLIGEQKITYDFEVLYIGQAFGEDGSRNAMDRLKKHETLQKIAVQGIPAGYTLMLLMIEIVPANRIITMFNPFAKDKEHGSERIAKGLDKLRNTTEAERTTLYEASLIRYFQPRFNKEFKNSFPSTNMKILSDCYAKDIAAVTAEICFDNIPFRLYSPTIKPKASHIAHHDLHSDEARRVFFTSPF